MSRQSFPESHDAACRGMAREMTTASHRRKLQAKA